ncbi:MAG TPA: ATP-binding cassette domain-containing protein, partial [Saprospiraceae bacterium]|nr:ATP-binding cassette domain-containing protein [Saprospiraceae bacterium]
AIAKGEIVALTGSSGSGKTSVAMAILGMLPIGIHYISGEITWVGKGKQALTWPRDKAQWPALRGTRIGFTQQDVYGAFDPILRMGKQMIMIIRERASEALPDMERALREKMAETGLQDIDRIWNSYPHQLSGGQLQRCQLCMAIIIQPELLITDEPTSAIDQINQLELLDVLSMLRSKYGIAVLCITHEPTVVNFLADRVVDIGVTSNKDLSSVSVPEVSIEDNKPIILEVKDLVYKHHYGGLMLQKGADIGPFSFRLQKASCLGVIGESGSGKSTLAQMLVGLLTPDSGELKLDGQLMNLNRSTDVHHLRSKVQLVMQDGRGSLHPNFTIRRTLEEVVTMMKHNHSAYDVDLVAILGEVGLIGSVLERKPDTLSGGECLRVSIARALLVLPEILICDESTSALDRETRDGILDLLKSLIKNRSLALIIISHDDEVITELATDLLVMSEGKVVEQGKTEEIRSNPSHAVTKKILATHATLHCGKHP